MNPALNLVKEDIRLPDSYQMEFTFHSGLSETYDVVSHVHTDTFVEIYLKNDTYKLIPWNAIRSVGFDKNFTTVVKLHKEKKHENGQNTQQHAG